MIRPRFGERRARVRELYRTRIKVMHETVEYRKGERDLRGDPLARNGAIPVGAVLVPVWDGRPRPQDFIYRDIYEAIRGQEYTRDGYESKNGELAALRISAEAARGAVELFIRYGGLNDAERTGLAELLARLAVRFESSRRPMKVEAAFQFGRAAGEKDSRGRPNPGARATRTVAGRRRLELRITEIAELLQAIGPRRTALISELDRMWVDGWNVAWNRLGEASDRLMAIEGNVASSVRSIEFALKEAEACLAPIDVEPYLAARHTIRGEIETARGHVLRRRWREALEEIARARDGIRYKRAGRNLHEILLGMAILAGRPELLRSDGEPSDSLRAVRRMIGEFRGKLEGLSDARFKRPVKEDVLALISAADDALARREGSDWYERAREYAKGALAYL